MPTNVLHDLDPVLASHPDFDAELDLAHRDLRASVTADSLPEMAFRLAVARLRQRVAPRDGSGLLAPPPTFFQTGEANIDVGRVVESNCARSVLAPTEDAPGGGARQRLLTGDVLLPPRSSAPATARRWVSDQLAATGLFPDGRQDGDKLSDLLICTSELVNVSLIANSTTMVLQLRVLDQTVRVSLRDDHAPTAESRGPRKHVQLFVLRIFDGMTDDWGIDPVPGGRTLWFELTVA